MLRLDADVPCLTATTAAKMITDRLHYCFSCDHNLRCLHLFVGLDVVTDVGKEDTARLFDKQQPSTASKAAKISDVREMADQQPVKPGRGEVLPQLAWRARKSITAEFNKKCRVPDIG